MCVCVCVYTEQRLLILFFFLRILSFSGGHITSAKESTLNRNVTGCVMDV